MSRDVGSVLDDVLALPRKERARVAAEALASIAASGEEDSPVIADEFARELERRVERVASGESVGVDYETALRMLDEDLAHG